MVPAPSTIVVKSFVTVTFFARPRFSIWRFSSFAPRSSLTNFPPVRTATSSIIALRRSPKPGALTAQTLSTPRSLLTTSAASASPSTSSATTSSGFPACATFSSSGMNSRRFEIFFSWRST